MIVFVLMGIVYTGIFLFFAALCFGAFIIIFSKYLKIGRRSFLTKNFQKGWIKGLQQFIIKNKIVNNHLGIWNGEGTQWLSKGRKYVGEFKNGLWNGQGELTDADGRSYEGGFKNGTFHGQGTYLDSDGSKTVAEYKDGEAAFVEVFFKDGKKYVGEYKDGMINGQGTFSFPDGKKFVGEFKNKIPWEGQIFDKNGELTDKIENGKTSKNFEETDLITLATKVSKSKSTREGLDEVRSFTKELKD
jgi:hypothetical protein